MDYLVCYLSVAFVDQGYDISETTMPLIRFWDHGSFDELIAQANKRDIKIVMDLVVNHCSDQHPSSRRRRTYPATMRIISTLWKDRTAHLNLTGAATLAVVCGKLPGTNFLHKFPQDPARLKWQNPRLRQEIYQMVNWWLERSIAGFRIDAINIKKNLTWQSYQPIDQTASGGAAFTARCPASPF